MTRGSESRDRAAGSGRAVGLRAVLGLGSEGKGSRVPRSPVGATQRSYWMKPSIPKDRHRKERLRARPVDEQVDNRGMRSRKGKAINGGINQSRHSHFAPPPCIDVVLYCMSGLLCYLCVRKYSRRLTILQFVMLLSYVIGLIPRQRHAGETCCSMRVPLGLHHCLA